MPGGQDMGQVWYNEKREETQQMSDIFSSTLSSTLEVPQILNTRKEGQAVLHPGPELQQPMVMIKGDITFCVTKSESALQPVIGGYYIETEGMQEPLELLWYAEGQVLDRRARSTPIAFDLRGTPAGQTRTRQVAVQAVESGGRGRVVQSGVFVQISVTSDEHANETL